MFGILSIPLLRSKFSIATKSGWELITTAQSPRALSGPIAIIVIHRHVNYTDGYKRQYGRRCRPGPRRGRACVSVAFLLRRPVKVKSLVCLNQCARKRPSYLCPVITETSFASQTLKTHPRHPSPTSRPLLMVSSPFRG